MADMLDRARPLGFAEWCMDDDDLLGGHYPGRQQRHALAVLSLPPSELVDPKAPRGFMSQHIGAIGIWILRVQQIDEDKARSYSCLAFVVVFEASGLGLHWTIVGRIDCLIPSMRIVGGGYSFYVTAMIQETDNIEGTTHGCGRPKRGKRAAKNFANYERPV